MSIIGQFASILAAAVPAAQAEAARSAQNDDSDFTVADYIYYFELLLPASLLGTAAQSFLIPLVLGPNAINMSEPFAVEAQVTQNGLYVEQQGILQRSMSIRGNTGWQPIVSPVSQAPTYLTAGSSLDKSFSRSLPRVVFGALSGQRHVEYLQDALRTYADAKRDPAHAADVRLFFHNPKDNEDWEVVPRSFGLDRSANAPLSYPYNIELLLVGPATQGLKLTAAQPDANILTTLRDALGAAQTFVSVGTAYLNQLTAVEAQMRRVFKNMGAVVNSCTTLLNAATAFVSGAVSIIQAPYALCAQTIVLIDGSLAEAETAGQNAAITGKLYAGIPALYVQAWRGLVDNLALIGTHPEVFAAPTQSQIAVLRANQGIATATTTTTAYPNPTSFAAALRATGQILAADIAQNTANAQGATAVQAFTGTHPYIVQQGDTLVSIAAKTMGDARLWVYLALANGLSLPLAEGVSTRVATSGADTVATSGSLILGATLLIPDYTPPVVQNPNLPILGSQSTDDLPTQVLGRDFALNFTQGGTVFSGNTQTLVDLVATPTGDDVVLQSGVKNLQQVALIRLNTELGEDQLMPQLGLSQIVGLGLVQADAKAITLRIKSALLADARIAGVSNITAGPGYNTDAIVLSATLDVAGLQTTTGLSA